MNVYKIFLQNIVLNEIAIKNERERETERERERERERGEKKKRAEKEIEMDIHIFTKRQKEMRTGNMTGYMVRHLILAGGK